MIARLIPGWVYIRRFLFVSTFLGVVIHEYAHKHMAEDFGCRVKEVCYFQFGDPAGYVVHETPRTYTGMFAVSAAPFLLNTATGYTAFLGSSLYVVYHGTEALSTTEIVAIAICLWIGLSAILHAFPSPQDTQNIWTSAKHQWEQTPLGILGTPIFLIRHYRVVLSLPVIALLIVLNKTRAFGSALVYSGLIAGWSYYTLEILRPMIGI